MNSPNVVLEILKLARSMIEVDTDTKDLLRHVDAAIAIASAMSYAAIVSRERRLAALQAAARN